MLVERIWAANDLRNFHYLIACSQTGEALIVDPLDARQCLETARRHGFNITQVLNTHEHLDHTAGNAEVVAATRARVLAHAGAANRIGGVDRGLARGDVIKVGRTVELEALDTPGHTRSHVCLLAHGDAPALFCGDTLFNAGAGNCHNGGDPGLLYETFVNQLATLVRRDAGISGARIHGAQPGLHAGPRARQCRRGARAGHGARARSRACARHDPR